MRTTANAAAADATLVVTFFGAHSKGTELTHDQAVLHGKPVKEVSLSADDTSTQLKAVADDIVEWLRDVQPAILNVGGPRETEAPIYWKARECLGYAFASMVAARDADDTARANAFELFRHWDNIRWQGPAWLTAAAAIVASTLSNDRSSEWEQTIGHPVYLGLSLFLTAFGSVLVVLQSNLIWYHCQTESTGVRLPFSFKGGQFWRTASGWLLLYTYAATVAACVPSVIVLWRQWPHTTGARAAVPWLFTAAWLLMTAAAGRWARKQLRRTRV
jgi:hypothetical protein